MEQKSLWAALMSMLLLACASHKPEHNVPHEIVSSQTPAHEIRLLSYNLYLRAPGAFFWNQQAERIDKIRPYLSGYDVLMFQEVFGRGYKEDLVGMLREEYPYHSQRVGGGGGKQDAGLLVLSRWPIATEKQIEYEDCGGSDCLATKGALYLKINKQDRPYHIFTTHTQAHAEHQEVREAQFRQLKSLIEAQAPSASEAVIIAGDLNVDLYTDSLDQAYSNMLEILQAVHPPARPAGKYVPTFDVEQNALARGENREYLDYILLSRNHLPAQSAFNQVRPFRAGELDLSDHYAVEALFSF